VDRRQLAVARIEVIGAGDAVEVEDDPLTRHILERCGVVGLRVRMQKSAAAHAVDPRPRLGADDERCGVGRDLVQDAGQLGDAADRVLRDDNVLAEVIAIDLDLAVRGSGHALRRAPRGVAAQDADGAAHHGPAAPAVAARVWRLAGRAAIYSHVMCSSTSLVRRSGFHWPGPSRFGYGGR